MQLETYRNISKVAAVLATASPNDTTYKDARTDFYKHYWSLLSMVKDGKVEAEMVNLDRAIRNHEFLGTGGDRDVRIRVYSRANALRGSIQNSWTISLGKTNTPKIEDAKDCDKQQEDKRRF